MIQVQANITVGKKLTNIELWQLSREDANAQERELAQAIETTFNAVADQVERSGMKVKRTIIAQPPAKPQLDIASVWILRPTEDGFTGPIRDGVRAINTSIDPPRWAIKSAENVCLSKAHKKWTFEPFPSSRDEAFYEDCRWASLEEAIAFVKPLIPRWRREEKRELAEWKKRQANHGKEE